MERVNKFADARAAARAAAAEAELLRDLDAPGAAAGVAKGLDNFNWKYKVRTALVARAELASPFSAVTGCPSHRILLDPQR